MKATFLFIVVMGLCLLVVPMIALRSEPAVPLPLSSDPSGRDGQDAGINADSGASVREPTKIDPAQKEPGFDEGFEAEMAETALAEEAKPADPGEIFEEAGDSFRILNESTGEVEIVSQRDFVRGAIAAEMPAEFHPEALKAQAVAAKTFAVHNRLMQSRNPDPELYGADFKADPQNMKVYITEETAKEFYGDDSDFYWGKICDAADSVADYVLLYEGDPIVAAYHAISSGITEDASNVWIGSAPYLVPVKSEGDLFAPGFKTEASFSAAEAGKLLLEAYPEIKLSDGGDWFGEASRSDSGYVNEIKVGNLTIPGKELRQVFSLRSHNFDIEFDGENYIITVTGYGHGIGMSQYGADFMARQGSSFDEILNTYYSGVILTKTAPD